MPKYRAKVIETTVLTYETEATNYLQAALKLRAGDCLVVDVSESIDTWPGIIEMDDNGQPYVTHHHTSSDFPGKLAGKSSASDT